MEIAAQVLTLPVSEAASLGGLRLCDGVEVAESSDVLWVRVASGGTVQEEALLKLPATERRLLSSDGKLYVAGKRLPDGRLPSALRWMPLRSWLTINPAKAALPAHIEHQAALRLAPGGEAREAEALLVELAVFENYAAGVSELRLSQWKFAVNVDGRALVWGSPIPSLPGGRFAVRDGIATPLGWEWIPRVAPSVLAKLFQLRNGDLLLWEANDRKSVVRGEHWLPVQRGAVRASREALE